jgi:hypothetical protein
MSSCTYSKQDNATNEKDNTSMKAFITFPSTKKQISVSFTLSNL